MKSKWGLWMSLVILGLVLVGWFSWMTLITNKSSYIEKEVKKDLLISVKQLSPKLPRTQSTNTKTGAVIYVPNFYAGKVSKLTANTRTLEKDTLLRLNQNKNIPLLKITKIQIQDLTNEIQVITTVKYDVIAGITKNITFTSDIQLPHYKTKG